MRAESSFMPAPSPPSPGALEPQSRCQRMGLPSVQQSLCYTTSTFIHTATASPTPPQQNLLV
eukprot:scaffold30212_cov35-Tisochrysis_lutea.AAC.2